MRILVPIRVSRLADESTSPESQRDGALDYRDTHPGTVIIFTEAEDLDVSGATPIRERTGIAPWLTPAKMMEWDGIGGYEMDRLSRDMYDYLGFVREMEERGKIVIDLIDGTDTSTAEGRRTLEDRILAAQRYREMVGEKRARAAKRMSDAGRWGGGRVSFGYEPEKREWQDNGRTKHAYYLVKSATTGPIVRRMAMDVINGKPLNALAEELQAEGVKTPFGGTRWYEPTVRRILTSPALMGYVVKMEGVRGRKGKNIVTLRRDRDGQPIKFTEDPVLTPDEWRDLQDALKGRSRARGFPQARALLWNVAFCHNCSAPCEDELPCAEHDVKLYGVHRIKKQKPHQKDRYWCRRCNKSVQRERFEDYIEYLVLTHGHRPMLEQRTDYGDDYSGEILRLERRIERWRQDLDVEYDAGLEQAVHNAEEKIKQLIAGPHKQPETKLVPMDPPISIAKYWASLDTRGRNQFLRNAGTVFYADRDGLQGNIGWMAVDNPSLSGLQELLRTTTLIHVMTWAQVDEVLRKA